VATPIPNRFSVISVIAAARWWTLPLAARRRRLGRAATWRV